MIPTIRPEEALRRLQAGEAVLIDVREPEEWAEARIPGAVHLPLGALQAGDGEVPKDRPVILQCRSGNRSGIATQLLRERGHTNVMNLEGGILEWARLRQPLETGE